MSFLKLLQGPGNRNCESIILPASLSSARGQQQQGHMASASLLSSSHPQQHAVLEIVSQLPRLGVGSRVTRQKWAPYGDSYWEITAVKPKGEVRPCNRQSSAAVSVNVMAAACGMSAGGMLMAPLMVALYDLSQDGLHGKVWGIKVWKGVCTRCHVPAVAVR